MTERRCLTPPKGAALARSKAVRGLVPVLEADRLVLRAPVMDDFAVWAALMVPDAEGVLGGPHSEEEAWEAFCVYSAGWVLHGHGLWTISMRGGDVAGFILLGLEWGDLEPELAWMLLPEYRGKGIAEEAATAAQAYGFRTFGTGGFVSYVAAENNASNRLAERLGARRDRRVEAAIDDNGQTHVWRHGGHA